MNKVMTEAMNECLRITEARKSNDSLYDAVKLMVTKIKVYFTDDDVRDIVETIKVNDELMMMFIAFLRKYKDKDIDIIKKETRKDFTAIAKKAFWLSLDSYDQDVLLTLRHGLINKGSALTEEYYSNEYALRHTIGCCVYFGLAPNDYYSNGEGCAIARRLKSTFGAMIVYYMASGINDYKYIFNNTVNLLMSSVCAMSDGFIGRGMMVKICDNIDQLLDAGVKDPGDEIIKKLKEYRAGNINALSL